MNVHSSPLRQLLPLALLAAAACRGDDGRNPSASQAMVTSSDFRALYIASPDDEAIAKVDVESGAIVRLAVDGEPTRVARIGARIFVTLRAKRAVVEIEDVNDTLNVVRTVTVGPEPVGIVASETSLYVAVSGSDRVLELDGATLAVVREWNVGNGPRWLGLHPSGRSLYVASMTTGSFVHIDLDSGDARDVGLPAPTRFDDTGRQFALTARVTADPAASPDGRLVAIPTLYVDNQTPLTEPEEGEPMPPEMEGYGGRMTPSVTMVAVDGDGRPEPSAARIVAPAISRGYPSSVTFTPDSDVMLVTMEGGDAVAVIATEQGDQPDSLDFQIFSGIGVGVAEGPRSAAFVTDDRAFVFSFLARRINEIDVAPLRAEVESGGVSGSLSPRFDAFDDQNLVFESVLPAEVEEGRRLFYATTDARVSGPDSGISCATCHFEGRTDGLTWRFDRGLRQTPSLAGVVSARAPVRWQGDRATVVDDVLATSQGLMGGAGMTRTVAEQVAAFVDYTRAVDLDTEALDAAARARGEAIFNREDVGCAGCHSGALFSDKAKYDMFGFSGVKTPSLLGVAATPPYFHDGSAPTLRSVLDVARSGLMGNTSMLDESQMADLELYLRSL